MYDRSPAITSTLFATKCPGTCRLWANFEAFGTGMGAA